MNQMDITLFLGFGALFYVFLIRPVVSGYRNGRSTLSKCTECEGTVSTEAKACPHCGAKVKKPVGILGWTFSVILLISMFRCTLDKENSTPMPPKPAKSIEQIEREQREEAAFQWDVTLVKTLRSSMKNPASFEFVSANRIGDDTLCVTYRGTNSFNAIITEMKAINRATATEADWNRACAGKKAKDMSIIKFAL